MLFFRLINGRFDWNNQALSSTLQILSRCCTNVVGEDPDKVLRR